VADFGDLPSREGRKRDCIFQGEKEGERGEISPHPFGRVERKKREGATLYLFGGGEREGKGKGLSLKRRMFHLHPGEGEGGRRRGRERGERFKTPFHFMEKKKQKSSNKKKKKENGKGGKKRGNLLI